MELIKNNSEKPIKYPENLYLMGLVKDSGKSITHLAKKIGYARKIVSDTVNGHYKGDNVIPKLKEAINPTAKS